MTVTSKREASRILRAEAESIRRHGFTNIFSHQFVCLLGQVLRKEVCEGCLLRDYVPEENREEAFPCQHLDDAAVQHMVAIPGLPEQVAARLLGIAEELEASAEAEAASYEKGNYSRGTAS